MEETFEKNKHITAENINNQTTNVFIKIPKTCINLLCNLDSNKLHVFIQPVHVFIVRQCRRTASICRTETAGNSPVANRVDSQCRECHKSFERVPYNILL